MTLYAESSAILAWLLGDSAGGEVIDLLESSSGIVASDLTLVECERAIIRGWTLRLFDERERVDKSSTLARTSAHWSQLAVSQDVVERTRRPFPVEPVRSLDALHLSSALLARGVVSDLRILTLDQRIRENAVRLGFEVVP